MKKKLTQLLMLLAVAVGMGVTVSSCKDTNEDLRNEWREEAIKENASLTEAFNQKIQKLENDLKIYQDALDQIKSCSCDKEGMSNIIKGLQAQIDNLNKQITTGEDADGNKTPIQEELESVSTNVTNITNIINDVDGQGTNLTMFISNVETAQGIMEDEIKKLQGDLQDALEKLDNIKGCEQDCAALAARLAALELRMSESEQKIKDAMDLATAANTAAGEAKLTAAQAQSAADAAKQIADAAQAAADQAKADAGIAKADADKAQETADAAKQLAEGLQTLLSKEVQDLNDKIQSIDTRVSQLDTKTQEAWDKATAAASKAEINAAAIDRLDDNIDDINDAIGGLSESITTLTKNYGELKEKLTGLDAKLDEKVGELTGKIEAVDTKVEGLSGKFETLSKDLKDVQDKLDQVEQDCKDNLTAAKEYAYEQIQVAIANLATKDDIANMATKDDLTDLATKEALEKKYDELKALIKDCECTDWSTIIAQIQDELKKLDDKADKTALEALKTELTNKITSDIAAAVSEIETKLEGKASAAELEALKTRVEELEAIDHLTETRVQEMIDLAISTAVADLEAADDATNERIDNLVKDLEAIQKTYVSTTVWEAENSRLQGLIDANTTTIGEVKKSISEINETIESIKEDMGVLESRISTAEEELATALADIEDLKDDVAAIQEALAKQVTGIIIQSATMPNFGGFSAPFGVASNILIAYYGKPTDDVEFPTSSTANYVRPDEALTDADMEMIGWDGIFESRANKPLTYENGYAGKLYMTINPNTADLNGLKLDIVNTVDEVSPIKLDGMKKSDKKLQFGFSRADNGFYEAEARVPNLSDLDKINRPTIETAALKDAVKEIINKRQNASMNVIAEDMYKVFAGLRFDRSGLKCAYTENGNEHAVYSEYNLAATAMQPLSLAAYKDLNIKNLPGYVRLTNVLNRFANKAKNQIHVYMKDFTSGALVQKVVNLQINDIVMPQLTEKQLNQFILKMDTTFIMGGLSYHLDLSQDVEVPIKFEKDLEIPVKMNGITASVSVPVKISKEVEVDMSQVSITVPTVVVKGTATGHPSDVVDKDGQPVSSLVIPVLDADNKVTGYTEIPLENFDVSVTVQADNKHGGQGGAGTTIDINGKPVAKVEIDETFTGTGTVDIDKEVTYHLVIDQTVTKTLHIVKDLKFGDPLLDKDGNAVLDADGNIIYTDQKSFNLKFNYDMRDAAKDLYGTAAGAIDGINDGLIKDVREIVDELKKTIQKINNYEQDFNNTIDNYVGKIQSYLDKFNQKGVSFINSTNERLQPMLLASNGKGIKRLSSSAAYPTKLTSEFDLLASTWSLEILVPLARKHVAVTNVINGNKTAKGGDADCKTALRAVNKGEMNKVIDGSRNRIAASGLQPGFVYEIAYSALDFQGKIATRKYYVTVE